MSIRGAARIGADPRGAVLWRNLVTGQTAYWYINDGANITGMYMPTVGDPNWEIVGPR